MLIVRTKSFLIGKPTLLRGEKVFELFEGKRVDNLQKVVNPYNPCNPLYHNQTIDINNYPSGSYKSFCDW